jgi:serine/threonine protein kinase
LLPGGERVGHYEIVAPLGSGGMGEVYRARDLRLGREVALKILPAGLSGDAARLRRFEHEARAVTALSHPNIITVHDVGSFGERLYIAMELVEGKTLRRILASGALPVQRAIDLAAQLADGLAKAHEAGIVHRDLKPENVMVSRDGFVKILDFGLAKLASDSGERSTAETLSTQEGTLPGTLLGTVAYMSPEQAQGEPLTPVSDQFAFGAVL